MGKSGDIERPEIGSTTEGEEDVPSVDAAIAVTIAHVNRLIDIARKARLPVMAVWVPAAGEMFGGERTTPEKRLFRQARRELSSLAKSTPGFFFVDTTELISSGRAWEKRKGTLRLSDGHFNREGAQWYGDLARPSVLGFLRGVGWTRRKKN